jgi:hypothetical protein
MGVAATIVASAPASAGADTYSVYSCRTPAGTVAARDGWLATATPGLAGDSCASAGALLGHMPPSSVGHAPGAYAAWTVGAPVGLPITGYVLYRWAQVTNTAAGDGSYNYSYQLLEDGSAVETLAPVYGTAGDLGSHTAPLSDANVVVRSGIRTPWEA